MIFTADLLKQVFKRVNDIIYRIGGDEFAILLVNQSIDEAAAICSSFNKLFRKNKPKGKTVMRQITLSMGIVTAKITRHSKIDHLINNADEALYQAKNQGKNQIVIKEYE